MVNIAQRPVARPVRGLVLFTFSLLTLLLLAFLLPGIAVAEEPVGGDDVDLEAVTDLIQRECLRAYPPELLAEMAPNAAAIPAEVDADPELQEDFFEAVLKLDKGRFYPFLLEDLFDAFRAYVKPGTRFIDLGSGDGRIVFLANILGADAYGIEYDPKMIEVSRRAADALGDVLDEDRLHLIEGDFFAHDWSQYDTLFYFDLSSFEQLRVRKKLSFELDHDAHLLVGHERAPFGGLEVETTFDFVTIYRQPRGEGGFDPNFSKRCQKEIVEMHDFFERWMNGTVEPTDKNFSRLSASLAPSFTIIVPEGHAVKRQAMTNNLRQAWGSWRDGDKAGTGRLQIENVRPRFIVGPVAAVTFDERQIVEGKVRLFANTAIFQLRHGTPNGVQWLHAQETERILP